MKRISILLSWVLGGMPMALAQQNDLPPPLSGVVDGITQAFVKVVDYPPSTNWWAAAPYCRPGSSGPNISVEVRRWGTSCGVAVISKSGNVYADAINDGGPVGFPVANNNVAAVAYGNTPCTGYCYHKILLYGIESNGRIVVAAPALESGQDGGRRTAFFAGNNNILVKNPDNGDSGRLYCFDGTDWYQGLGPTSCDMAHHARLTNLRAPGDPFLIVRDEYYGSPVGLQKVKHRRHR